MMKQKQMSIVESQDRVRPWDINDRRAQKVHRCIIQMIALDCQPFSIIEDPGFTQLLHELEPRYSLPSRKYFVEKILFQVRDETMAAVKKEISGVPYYSFTTDEWSRVNGQ